MTEQPYEEWMKEALVRRDEHLMALRINPDGGNLYDPHPLQIHSGRFWRCAHGRTGFKTWQEWEGCEECRLANPSKAAEFEKREQVA